MKKIFILWGVLCLTEKAVCQVPLINSPTKGNQYIEGARLVIDILQLFKKNSAGKAVNPQQNLGAYCNFCLFNSDSTQKIKVTLRAKNVPAAEPLILVIKPKNKECSLQIQCGIYNCKIETPEEKIISWGDILINEKEILISR